MDFDLDNMISDINNMMTEIKNSEIPKDLPSNMSLMLGGVSNSKAVDFLFSTKMDTLLEKIMDLINSGKLELLLSSQEDLFKLLDKLGFGSGSFKGPISTNILNSLGNIVNSPKYAKTKSGFKKILMISKKLKSERDKFRDPYMKAKYDAAIYSIKQLVKIIHNVWKNRKLVNDKMIQGLKGLINEENQEVNLVNLIG